MPDPFTSSLPLWDRFDDKLNAVTKEFSCGPCIKRRRSMCCGLFDMDCLSITVRRLAFQSGFHIIGRFETASITGACHGLSLIIHEMPLTMSGMPRSNTQESPSEWDLTIITVCRNVKDSISKTVQSVLAQKKKASISIEHVYVDGASTDGTPELLEQLLHNGDIEQYVSEPDKGIYDAMNKGIRMAHGKVLFFLNSDDILIEETDLAHLVRPIVDGECDATYGQWYRSDRPKEICPSFYHLYYTVTPCSHQAYFMSKEWYEKLGGYNDAEFRCLADGNLMWIAFSKGVRIVHVEYPVVMFVVGGFSSNAPVEFLNELVLVPWRHRERIAQHMRKSSNYSRFIAQYLATNILIYPLFFNNGGKHIHETAQRLRGLCDIVCRSGIGLTDRCILKLLAHFGLRAFEAGKTGRVRQLLLRIPCLFLEEPTDAKYTDEYWAISLKARVLRKLRNV